MVLQCFIIGHFRSRDLGSKVKKLVILTKSYKTKPKQLVTLNFQGKHVMMWFRSCNLVHMIGVKDQKICRVCNSLLQLYLES